MIKLAQFVLLLGSAFLLMHVKTASAKTTVSVNSTSSNTTHISGTTRVEVTTNGETKVIETDKNEDINYESEDGTTKVHISNSNSDSTITPPAKPTLSPEAKEKIDEMKKDHAKKKEEIKKKLEEQKKEIKEKLDDKTFNLREFFEKEFPFLKKLFSALPLV